MGLIREDGQELYVINEECLSGVMRHPWMSVNVVPYLPIRSDDNFILEWDQKHPEYQYVLGMDRLALEVRKFLTEVSDVELWAYYGAYDHVVLCQIFGDMTDLPAGIPMWTHELMQLQEQYPHVPLPPQPINAHHAMADARWVRDAHKRIWDLVNVASNDTLLDNIVEAEVVDGP